MAHTNTEKAVAGMIRRSKEGGREEWRLVIVIGWRRGRESEHNIISQDEVMLSQVDALHYIFQRLYG